MWLGWKGVFLRVLCPGVGSWGGIQWGLGPIPRMRGAEFDILGGLGGGEEAVQHPIPAPPPPGLVIM